MPSARLQPKVARLLGAQMFGIILVLLLVLAFVLYHTRPNHPLETTGGIDATNVTIAWIAFIVVVAALAGIHFLFGRQLMSEAKGVRRDIRSW
jgi:uncharacterized YccA/Bax inhibitor family protein